MSMSDIADIKADVDAHLWQMSNHAVQWYLGPPYFIDECSSPSLPQSEAPGPVLAMCSIGQLSSLCQVCPPGS